jgi:hypothetical protein
MSKETFEAEWVTEDPWTFRWAELQAQIEKHGGRIVWTLPTPEGAGCTCSDVHTVVEICAANYSPAVDFDKTGPWHTEKCALYVPF